MRYLFLYILGLSAVLLSGQQYNFTNYSLNNGLPQSQVLALLEDSRANIWMGTNGGGLARFDGLDFVTFDVNDGLKDNYILSLTEDRNMTIWIGSTRGLSSYDHHQFINYDLGIEKPFVRALLVDQQNKLWIGTDKGLFQKKDSSFMALAPDLFPSNSGAVHFIEEVSEGEIWVGTDNGIYRFRGDSISSIDKKDGLSSKFCQSMDQDILGNKWIGSYGSGLDLIDSSGIRSMNRYAGLDRTVVFSVLCDANGMVWAATQDKGVCRFNPKDSSVVWLTERDQLANNHVRILMNDRWGNYWMGTSGGGVSKYSGQQFVRYGKSRGLPGNYIYTITPDVNDGLWIGSSGGGISHSSKEGFVRYGSDSGFVDDKIRTAFVDRDSLLWMGIDGKGLACFDGDTFRIYDVRDGLAGNYVKSIVEDGKQRLWVASAGGGISLISKESGLDSLEFIRYRNNGLLPTNRIVQLLVDTKDRIWYASQGQGIGCIQSDSSLVRFGVEEGMNSGDTRSLCMDGFGHIWTGGTNGLNVLWEDSTGLKVRSIDSEVLSSRNIYQISFDGRDQLWVGTEKGLDRLQIDSSTTVLEHKHFGADEGFSGVETNLNASCLDSNGNLWFGTVNGLFKYLKQQDQQNNTPPVLNFREISLNYTPLSPALLGDGKLVQFEYDQNHLSFDFIGITQTIPKKVQYKWRLKGLEEQWSPVVKRNSVTYSNLQPGQYVFQVLSVNESGVWNTAPLEMGFEIKSPIWQRPWFQFTAWGSLFLMLALIVGSRIRSIRRKAREKQQKLKMERDLISLEQKALRLQMNPHFIFHTLNNIQALISTKDESTARLYLAKFSKLMRQILENSRSPEISLENEIETLDNYLKIEQFCHDQKFEFEIEVEEGLEAEFVNIPPMLLQPFVENAVQHGITPMEGQGHIHIAFQFVQESIQCVITDNGIGRVAASKHRDSNHKSMALDVTRERLELLDQGSTGVTIEDLEQGTRVTISLGEA